MSLTVHHCLHVSFAFAMSILPLDSHFWFIATKCQTFWQHKRSLKSSLGTVFYFSLWLTGNRALSIQQEMALVVMSGVRENSMWIRDNEDLVLIMFFPSFGDWDWGHTLSPLHLFTFCFLSFALFSFCLFGVGIIIAHSCQFHSTRASISKRANTYAHTRNCTSIFLKIDSVARKQTKGWRNILQYDSTSLEQLCENSSLMFWK